MIIIITENPIKSRKVILDILVPKLYNF